MSVTSACLHTQTLAKEPRLAALDLLTISLKSRMAMTVHSVWNLDAAWQAIPRGRKVPEEEMPQGESRESKGGTK